jgi:hypothetical protein
MKMSQLRELVEAECRRLDALGSADAIANEFWQRGITGKRQDVGDCPLARALSDTLMIDTGTIRVGGDKIFDVWCLDSNGTVVPLCALGQPHALGLGRHGQRCFLGDGEGHAAAPFRRTASISRSRRRSAWVSLCMRQAARGEPVLPNSSLAAKTPDRMRFN